MGPAGSAYDPHSSFSCLHKLTVTELFFRQQKKKKKYIHLNYEAKRIQSFSTRAKYLCMTVLHLEQLFTDEEKKNEVLTGIFKGLCLGLFISISEKQKLVGH